MSTQPLPSKVFSAATNAQQENIDLYSLTGATDERWEIAALSTLLPRWSQLYPYQLLIVEKVGDHWRKSGEVFTLPIPPQTLDIQMPFAINVSATLGGVVEEHNGVPFRMISLTGTTGVLPLRGTADKGTFLNGITATAGVLAGTISQVGTTVRAGGSIANTVTAFTGARSQPPNVIAESDTSIQTATGYYQFQLLQRFLEAYAVLKTLPEGKNKALAFAVWKEGVVYICTPRDFSVSRSAASPMEYPYRLTLQAWRRTTLDGNASPTAEHSHIAGRNPAVLAQVLNGLDQARRALDNVRKTFIALRQDIDHVLFDPLRQSVLFVKDVMGVALTVRDLATDLVQDLQNSVLERIGLAGFGQAQSMLTPSSEENPQIDRVLKQLSRLANARMKDRSRGGDATAQSAAELLQSYLQKGAPSDAAKPGKSVRMLQETASDLPHFPAHQVFLNPNDYTWFWERVSINSLNLPPEVVRRIEGERANAARLRRIDFEGWRDQTLAILADFSDRLGIGDPVFSAVYGLPDREAQSEPTDSDWEAIHALTLLAQQYDQLAASATIDRSAVENMDYYAGLARRSGLAFEIPVSKFLIPYPYGYTLEQLAAQYLGSPDRWVEIAALNGLRSPYVDEIGWTQHLLVNGAANRITVEPSGNYYAGQPVWISSNDQRREKRRITQVDRLGVTQMVLTLDGTSDLERFTTQANAQVHAFLPDTINSLQYIYIPSTEPTDEQDWRTKDIPGVDKFDPLIRSAGIDLLLDTGGDLVITTSGSTRLALGLARLIQRVRIVMSTVPGSVLRHPEFGLGVKHGTSTADVDVKALLSSARKFFSDDQSFSGIDYASIRKSGNNLRMTMGVGIAGTSKTVPISIDVLR
jgi:hypothetical protein